MDMSTLTKQSKGHLCAIINTYGTGQHAFADPSNLEFFELSYIKEVLGAAYLINEEDTKRCSLIDDISEELGYARIKVKV